MGNQKKRVALFPGKMATGGVESVVLNWIHNVDPSKYSFDLFVSREQPEECDEELKACGCKIIYIGEMGKKGIFRYMIDEIVALRKNGKYDIAHINGIYTSTIHILTSRIARVRKVVYHVHNTEDARFGDGIIGKIVRWLCSSFIVAHSDNLVACGVLAGQSIFGSNHSFSVIHNAIDSDRFCCYDSNRIDELRKRNQIDEDAIVISIIGRFTEVKNQIGFIKSMVDIVKYIPNLLCIFAGEGETLEECESLVRQEKLEKNVRFWGKRNDIPDILNLSDIFALPSKHEGLPVSVIEAQACGIPCLLSNTITKEVDIGIAAIEWVDVNAPTEAWVRSIKKLYGKKEHNQLRIKEKLIESGYSSFNTITELMEVYEA